MGRARDLDDIETNDVPTRNEREGDRERVPSQLFDDKFDEKQEQEEQAQFDDDDDEVEEQESRISRDGRECEGRGNEEKESYAEGEGSRGGEELEPVQRKVSSVNDVSKVPNGGLRAWLQVLGSFFLFFNSW